MMETDRVHPISETRNGALDLTRDLSVGLFLLIWWAGRQEEDRRLAHTQILTTNTRSIAHPHKIQSRLGPREPGMISCICFVHAW